MMENEQFGKVVALLRCSKLTQIGNWGLVKVKPQVADNPPGEYYCRFCFVVPIISNISEIKMTNLTIHN